jgi:hypothetical protein
MSEERHPIIDHEYLDELRHWVGQTTLVELAEIAPEVFGVEAGAVRQAWQQGDVDALREAGHRLKGVASSLACRRLASLGQFIQHAPQEAAADPDLGNRLSTEFEAALAALAALFPPQPQAIPVPPKPQ